MTQATHTPGLKLRADPGDLYNGDALARSAMYINDAGRSPPAEALGLLTCALDLISNDNLPENEDGSVTPRILHHGSAYDPRLQQHVDDEKLRADIARFAMFPDAIIDDLDLTRLIGRVQQYWFAVADSYFHDSTK